MLNHFNERRPLKKNSRLDLSDVIDRLHQLAHNLWWSWNPRAEAVFRELSSLTWEASNHNPVAVLAQFSEAGLRARLGARNFLMSEP